MDEDFCTEAEIRFAPPGGTNIQDMFHIIQECNKLHPVEADGKLYDTELFQSLEDWLFMYGAGSCSTFGP